MPFLSGIDGLVEIDAAGVAGDRFIDGDGRGRNVFDGRSCLISDFSDLLLVLDELFVGLGSFDGGFGIGLDGSFAGVFRGEMGVGGEGLLRSQRDGGDHAGLDGACGLRVGAPMRGGVADDGPGDDGSSDGGVEEQSAGEASAVAAAVVRPFHLRGCHRCSYLLSSGWVTMLMLVMPACLTASRTEAKAPKRTLLSARM